MKIVFLGAGAFGLPSLEALAKSHEVLHVISQPDRPAGRGKVMTPTPISQWAIEHGVPLTRTEDANGVEVLEMLQTLKPECLVVIAFGQKLSDGLLAAAPLGGINLHSSLLPKYRGAAPINWAVINNDAEAGVCVIEVTNVMDGGRILAKSATPVGRSETAGELHDRLSELGAPLLPRVLDQLAAGTVTREIQEPGKSTRAPKLHRETAWVDFTQPAEIVSARIRGLSPWPGVQVNIADASGKAPLAATLLKCEATDSVTQHEPSACGRVQSDGTITCGVGSLRLLTLQPLGKKPMALAAFANGYKWQSGVTLASVMPVPAK